MIRKRIIPLVLLLAVLLTLPVYGESAGALSAESVSEYPGEQVRIDVNLQNPGIIATRLYIYYDGSVLRLDKAENGVVFPQNHATFGNDITRNPYTVLWDESTRPDNNTTSGTLVSLTFTILPDAKPGKTTVQVKVSPNDTFDYYTKLVPVADTDCTVNILSNVPDPTVALKEFTASRTIDYRTTITFTAIVENPVEGGEVYWFVNGQQKNAGPTYTEKEARETFTVQAKYMQNGVVLAQTETETVNVTGGFFAKVVAFFRWLFGKLPVLEQAFSGAEYR